jgi:colanic acid/amylovoran biosynthesis protein
MNVLIVNQHSNNFGDDAAGCAFVDILLIFSEVDKIDIIYNSNKKIPVENDKVRHHLDISFGKVGHKDFIKYYLCERPLKKASKNRLMHEWIELIKNCDVAVMSPCGANIGIYKDWASLIRILMVIIEKKKFIFQYNTIGKSGNFLFDKIAEYILKRSSVYVREKKSLDYLKTIGINAQWGPDTAFALKPINDGIRKNVVSFVPSSFDGWHPEFKKNPIDKKIINLVIPEIAKWMINNNFNLEILPHLKTEEEHKFNLLIKDKLVELGVKKVIIREDINNVWEYDQAIGTSRFCLGLRYHAIVLSAKNCRPFISICYENKMREVSNYTNMGKYLIDLHKIDTNNNIYDLMDDLIKNENKISDNLHSINEELQPKCKIPFCEFLENY